MSDNTQNTINTEASQITSMYLHPVAQKLIEEKFYSKTNLPPVLPSVPKQNKFYGKRTNGTVDPIIDLTDIQIAKDYFLNRETRYNSNQNNIRDYTLFVVGINCARRIGDLLAFTVSDFFNDDFTWREHFKIKEQKTGKPIKIKINSAVKESISMVLSNIGKYNLDTFIFQSREGVNQHIETRHAQKIMKEMSHATGLDKKYNIGTHSLRKTWARQYYVNHPTKLVIIQRALNHSHPDITLGYIGITQSEMDEAFDDNVL